MTVRMRVLAAMLGGATGFVAYSFVVHVAPRIVYFVFWCVYGQAKEVEFRGLNLAVLTVLALLFVLSVALGVVLGAAERLWCPGRVEPFIESVGRGSLVSAAGLLGFGTLIVVGVQAGYSGALLSTLAGACAFAAFLSVRTESAEDSPAAKAGPN